MNLFLMKRYAVTSSNPTATSHIGTAIWVRNSSGIPVTVIPRLPNNAINPRQMLWQICHEPNMLAAPEALPVAPISFSLAHLIMLPLLTAVHELFDDG